MCIYCKFLPGIGKETTPPKRGMLRVFAVGSYDEMYESGTRGVTSACDDETESVDPRPTAAVDTCDAVAARWDEGVSVIERVSEWCFVGRKMLRRLTQTRQWHFHRSRSCDPR